MRLSQPGISLIELLLVITLSAAAIVSILSLRPRRKSGIGDTLIEINSVMQKACTHALLTHKPHQCRFFFDQDMKIIAIGYAEIKNIDGVGSEKIPDQNRQFIKAEAYATRLIIDNKDELSRSNTRETWILVYPEGYTQEAELSLRSFDRLIIANLKLNPFMGIFEME